MAVLGNVPWRRQSLSIAFTVLATGIGLSCVLVDFTGHAPPLTLP